MAHSICLCVSNASIPTQAPSLLRVLVSRSCSLECVDSGGEVAVLRKLAEWRRRVTIVDACFLDRELGEEIRCQEGHLMNQRQRVAVLPAVRHTLPRLSQSRLCCNPIIGRIEVGREIFDLQTCSLGLGHFQTETRAV